MEAKNKKTKTATPKGWNINTDLCVDLKTFLRTDRITQLGKDYAGLLTRDGEDHYSFVETMPWTNKRNPYVFRGKYITITRRDDGSLSPNFRPLRMGKGFSLERYAFEVYRELRKGLEGLVENTKC